MANSPDGWLPFCGETTGPETLLAQLITSIDGEYDTSSGALWPDVMSRAIGQEYSQAAG